MKRGLLVILATGVVFSWGCAQRLTDFTVISTKNVVVEGKQGQRVKGEDKVLFCLAGFKQPNLKEAIDQAIEKGGGDALVDGVVYYKAFPMAGYEIEGTIVNTKQK